MKDQIIGKYVDNISFKYFTIAVKLYYSIKV